MIKKLIKETEKIFQTKQKWHKRFDRIHNIGSEPEYQTDKLRLILGNGRSGTSWLARILSKTETPLRYFHEFITYTHPRYYFSKKNDYSAVPYSEELSDNSLLLKLYRASTLKNISLERFIKRPELKIGRKDENYKYVLHKEVHSLLATEALVKKLNCPTIVITRNPIYNIDSLFNYQKISSIIWRNEAEYIQEPHFLQKFVPEKKDLLVKLLKKYQDDGKNRLNTVISKILTVATINQMLIKISEEYENVLHVQYDNLCITPEEHFSECARFFNFKFENSEKNELASTLTSEGNNNPMSIKKDTKTQFDREFYFLKADEAKLAEELLFRLDYKK